MGGAGDMMMSAPVLPAVSRGALAVKTSGCGSGYIGGMSDKSELTFGPYTETDEKEPVVTANENKAVATG